MKRDYCRRYIRKLVITRIIKIIQNMIKWAEYQKWGKYDYENVWRGVSYSLSH